MRKQKSQIRDVVSYLKENGSITSMRAWELFHATRLSAIVFKLRQLGYDIETIEKTGANEYGVYTYAEYVLIEVPENDVFSGKVQTEEV